MKTEEALFYESNICAATMLQLKRYVKQYSESPVAMDRRMAALSPIRMDIGDVNSYEHGG